MSIGVFDLFKIGVGPSSSHTVGPMRAAALFSQRLVPMLRRGEVDHVKVDLYGSLSATGKGHRTDVAIAVGLHGHQPDTVTPDQLVSAAQAAESTGVVEHLSGQRFRFDPATDLHFHRRSLPYHPNAMRLTAWPTGPSDTPSNTPAAEQTVYSIGGGFIVDDQARSLTSVIGGGDGDDQESTTQPDESPPSFRSAVELLQLCQTRRCTISEHMMSQEILVRDPSEVVAGILKIADVMRQCVDQGCRNGGLLPGMLRVRRRAPEMYQALCDEADLAGGQRAHRVAQTMDWLSLWALSVNEENASGGRVVTAPNPTAQPASSPRFCTTSIGVYREVAPERAERRTIDYFLTAAAIGSLFKMNASISGAEVGCQGEIGSACAMAAGGLAAVLGGTPAQVENAAEIAMEHNLGLTCDPVGGLVQIPCIERNAVASVKAVNAAKLALRGDGQHHVSLDAVIETMRMTGADMKSKYKETSRGGLAVNVTEC